jgi:ribosomal protein L37E
MSTNPLRREGGYWKPVLDYDTWDDPKADASHPESAGTGVQAPVKPPVRHDLCRHCGSEFVVDSPFCRMCGHGRQEAAISSKAPGYFLDFSKLCARLGLNKAAMACLIIGLMCIGAAITIGFIYTAGTLVDWQAIQIWRSEWLIAAGVAFVCGILLNSRTKSSA